MCKVMEDLRNESLQEGIKKGIIEGRKNGMMEAAIRMLSNGKYSLEEIAAISGLSLEEIEHLRTEQDK